MANWQQPDISIFSRKLGFQLLLLTKIVKIDWYNQTNKIIIQRTKNVLMEMSGFYFGETARHILVVTPNVGHP